MACVLITGGPGVGKTTLLADLGARGHATVVESARAIIAERRARGQSPRPDPIAFAQEILRRDTEKYHAQQGESGWVPSSTEGLSRRWACCTTLRRCLRRSSPPHF